MSGLGKSTRRFVIDTNIFVAAVKPFTKPARKVRRDSRTLSLLIKLITDEQIELIGNIRLASEYGRLAEEFNSKTSRLILRQLTEKMTIVVVDENALRQCKPYLPEKESADVIHAATSLQTRAVLITNDTDFDKIRRSGIIKVWSISEAIRRILTPV